MQQKKKNRLIDFLFDIVRGIMIGVAFIIPGFSGGSVAAILGIYEKLVGAIADLFKDFKKSFFTLLPIGIGMIAGIIMLLYPLSWALEAFPIPTVCLFVGLAIGGLPSVTDKTRGARSPKSILPFIVTLAVALALSFLPVGRDVDLISISFGGYLMLVLIGLIGSSALVMPGISGSMLLLILGYYNPLLSLITDSLLKGNEVFRATLALGCTAIGIAVGFFLISIIMKRLLKKYPRATYLAILGFIIGSIPTVFVSTAKEAGITFATLPSSVWYWAASALALAVGVTISLLLIVYSKKKGAKE